MSTRANILIKDDHSELWFYRHSDGYPSGTLPTLSEFCLWVERKLIRDNVGQASGWLIMLGAKEYEYYHDHAKIYSPEGKNNFMGWKVGAYEPTDRQHADIDFLYIVDLKKRKLTVKGVCTEKEITVDFKNIDIEVIESAVEE
jgi:hypothetical protein